MDKEQETIRFEGFHDVRAAMNNRSLSRRVNPEAFEYGNILDQVLMLLHGDQHRRRRRVENPLFRLENLQRYEKDVFPPIIERGLDDAVEAGRGELVELSGMLAVFLSALIAGVDFDHTSSQQARKLVHYNHIFNTGVGIEDYTGDRDELKSLVRRTLDAFNEEFLRSSRRRREAMLEEVAVGMRDESELPGDLLTTLLRHQRDLGMDDALLVRETAFFLESGAHTSGQTAANTMHYLFAWCADRPGAWDELADDIMLIQRCVHEALRLRPIIPLVKRRAVANTVVAGTPVREGALVLMDVADANRDSAVFGQDADDFNPLRSLEERVSLFGHSFSGGMHSCIGRLLAAGLPLRDNEIPDSTAGHLYGIIPSIVQGFVRRGAHPDPERTPEPVKQSMRWTRWERYPVRWRRTAA